MVYGGVLEGGQIFLRALEEGDCNGRYLSWMTDEAVNRYLESRHAAQSPKSLLDFVRGARASADSYPFAIIYRETGAHIGNVKVGPVHPVHRGAFIGYLVGDRAYWGRGVGTEAIRLAARFCFEELGLHKVSAGVLGPNVASARALEKAGFKREGCFREEALADGRYVDVYRYGLLRGELAE